MNFTANEIEQEFKDWLDIRFEKLCVDFPVLSYQYVQAYQKFLTRDSARYWADEVYKNEVSREVNSLSEQLYKEFEIIIAQDLLVYQIEDIFELSNVRDIFIYMERYILRKHGIVTFPYKID